MTPVDRPGIKRWQYTHWGAGLATVAADRVAWNQGNSCRWECTLGDECLAKSDSVAVVEIQNRDSSPAHWRQTHEDGAVPLKMLAPLVITRVKQEIHSLCKRINACEIRPFLPITARATLGEIHQAVIGNMLLGRNMLYMKSSLVVFLG